MYCFTTTLKISITDATCTEGNIRLVGGDKDSEGHMEVCHNSEWGIVCDNNWNNLEGIVVCHQLGFRCVAVTTNAYFGQGTGQIWFNNAYCSGSEFNLVTVLTMGLMFTIVDMMKMQV